MAESFGPLVDAHWLKTHLNEPNVRVCDVRWYLVGKAGSEEYARVHIPGAMFLDLDRDLSGQQGPGRHPIPSAAQFEDAMRKVGVHPGDRVVIYDDAGGSIAARVWWLLEHFGHRTAAVLTGGLDAWVASGGRLQVAEPGKVIQSVRWGAFVAHAPGVDEARCRVVDKHEVQRAMIAGGAILLDARAPERYRGDTEPVDARPGHIPGAINAPWSANVQGGYFKSSDALRQHYSALGVPSAKDVIVYCGSGVTACHNLLALRLSGFTRAKLYEGGYSDWARDESLPVDTGDSR